MHFSKQQLAEIDLLVQFDRENSLQGIKVHSNALPEQVTAALNLFEKGLVTQKDGGYLTELGKNASEHAHALAMLLTSD